jgi:hypothetical protein
MGNKGLAVKSGVRLGGRWKLSARHGEIPWVSFFELKFEAQVEREFQPVQFGTLQGEGNGRFSQMVGLRVLSCRHPRR